MTMIDDDQTTDAVSEAEVEDDVVEGDIEIADAPGGAEISNGAPSPSQVMTLGMAVMEYFAWEEEREAKRSKRKGTTAATPRRGVYVLEEAGRESVTRFLAHFGPKVPITELSPKAMEGFQETIGANAMDLSARLQPVKEFLRYCSKQMYTFTIDADGEAKPQNLGNFLRIKRPASIVRDDSRFEHEEAKTFQMTADGLQHLHEELEQLNAEMPEAVQAVAAAREDKDIRENAPLEAAREYQERLKSRIDEVEYQIAHAVVLEQRATGRAKLGSRVEVIEVDDEGGYLGEAREYTLVGTTEANAAARRISVESPLGRGLLDQPADRAIEIEAPNGRKRFRLLAVKG